MEDERIFYKPGEVVTLRLDLPNKPIMYIIDKVSFTFKDSKEKSLVGMKCRWFDTEGRVQEAIFNTKDLTKL